MTGCLLADIGGTYTRVGVAAPGLPIERVARYANKDLAGPGDALAMERARVERERGEARWEVAAAVAGPVAQGEAQLTNLGWRVSVEELSAAADAERAVLVNDYQALARALPQLGREQCLELSPGAPDPGAARAVLGPGTGLGVSGLIPASTGWGVIAGEGGHVTLPPADEEEDALIAALRAELGHVSAEAVLSGPGLSRLHRLLSGEERSPEAITAGLEAGDGNAERTMQQFLAFLGSVAGDLALTLGARGGVYLAGGILPRLEPRWLRGSLVAERFVAKGRFADYLAAIPLYRLDDPESAALAGLRAWLQDRAWAHG